MLLRLKNSKESRAVKKGNNKRFEEMINHQKGLENKMSNERHRTNNGFRRNVGNIRGRFLKDV